MRLIIISGRSGSGKSTALNELEDQGYYCIDNLPVALLSELLVQLQSSPELMAKTAVCIDARNDPTHLAKFNDAIAVLPEQLSMDVVYLDSNSNTLIKRFSETRRKHPLSSKQISLQDALDLERVLLEPVARAASLVIDTSGLNIHSLRQEIRERVVGKETSGMSLLIQSFGFKFGVPVDADYVFDLRVLSNPYWDTNLRTLNGLDSLVIDFLSDQDDVKSMRQSIQTYLDPWLPQFATANRSYMTVAVGCTGGQHRSVYMAERLAEHYLSLYDDVKVRHRELQRLK